MSTPTGSDAPPAGLRARVLTASLHARAAGHTTPPPDPISAIEGFRRSVDALGGVLGSLTDAQWRRPALRGLDVQSLIGHLVGVENDVQRALSGDAAAAHADHVGSTQASARRQHDRPVQVTRREWSAAAARTIELLAAADPHDLVAVHGLHLPAPSLCVVRTFEVWTHENDIRRAVGLPPSRPDASTLTLMTHLAVRVLPQAAAGADLPAAVALRLVLTGPGGGTWQIALGVGEQQATDVGIVTDAVGFCRLVANRLTPAELDTYPTGDPAIVSTILHAATTLALD